MRRLGQSRKERASVCPVTFDPQGSTFSPGGTRSQNQFTPVAMATQLHASTNEILAKIIFQNILLKAGTPSIPLMLNRRWRAQCARCGRIYRS